MLLYMEDLYIGVPGVVELLRSSKGGPVWMTFGIVFEGGLVGRDMENSEVVISDLTLFMLFFSVGPSMIVLFF